jgi:hypothetical protein
LDEGLGLGEEQEQGRVREKLALVAVLVLYHQAPQVCQTLLGSERYASSLRRVALREAERLTNSGHQHTLRKREQDRIYLQIAGQLCPTREPRQGSEDQGYREAKAVVAFSQADGAEVSKERHELLAKVLKAQITDCAPFRSLVAAVYQQAQGPRRPLKSSCWPRGRTGSGTWLMTSSPTSCKSSTLATPNTTCGRRPN